MVICVRRFAVIFKTEFLLFLRDFFDVFFTLVFPVLLLVLFGSIYGNEPIYAGAELGMMDVSVPAYAVMVTGVTGLMSFPLTLAGYKEKKIYKRFDATPVGKGQIILAQTAVHVFMALLGISILFIAGKLLYHIQIQGMPIPICVGLLLAIAAMFSMGFLFTAIGQDFKSTNLLCYTFYFIMLFLSGATIPDMLFPDTVKTIAGFLPMTYAVDLIQGLFAGNGLGEHGKELAVLGVLTIVFLVIGMFLYRRKDWT